MGKKKYGFNGLGVHLLAGVLINSSLAFASFSNIDCLKDRAVLGISSDECYVLEKLWDSTGGKSWYEHENWDSLTEVSSWDGVRVESGKVSALLLYSNNLKGTIPSELGTLVGLKRLALDNNHLEGKIPSSLGDASKLSYLALNNNRLSDTIPSSLGSLRLLKELYLNNNMLRGDIPESMGSLNQLMVLKLYENNLSGEIPATLGKLSSLDILSLSENHLEGMIPEELGRLSKLSYLDLKNNELSGSIPSSFSYLSSLTGLYLQNNHLTGTIPSSLGSIKNLVDLDLSFNQLSGVIPKSMDKLADLAYLNVANNQLSGSISMELVSLARLNYFNIEENQFVAADMEPILSELSYIPNYSVASQHSSDNDQVELATNQSKRIKIDRIEPLPTSTTIQVLENEEMAFFEVDTLKIVGTENFGDTLEVKGEGNWSIGEDGKIIFTPLDAQGIPPSDIAYTIEDNSGVESDPITVSIRYALPKEINGSRRFVFNLLKEEHNIASVELLSLEEFNKDVVESELSKDKKRLKIEGEGLWSIEESGTLTFIPEEDFLGTPTNITYLLKGENESIIGAAVVKDERETNSVSTFSLYGFMLMMFLSLLLGLFFQRKINEEEVLK